MKLRRRTSSLLGIGGLCRGPRQVSQLAAQCAEVGPPRLLERLRKARGRGPSLALPAASALTMSSPRGEKGSREPLEIHEGAAPWADQPIGGVRA
jgi:hypothetical protein